MGEMLEGTIVVDLQNQEAWNNARMPAHIALARSFRLGEEAIAAVTERLHERFQHEPAFAATLGATRPYQSILIHGDARETLIRLHFETLRAARPLTDSFDMSEAGDLYYPAADRFDGLSFPDGDIDINNVTFATKSLLVLKNTVSRWNPVDNGVIMLARHND